MTDGASFESEQQRAPGEPDADSRIRLEVEALGRLASLRARLGPEIGAAFDALAARLRLFDGGYFSHPMALPVLELPGWAAEHAGRRGAAVNPETTMDLVEAAAVGYLHVRIEDDWFDEGIGEPGAAMMLSNALFVRHQGLLARTIPRTIPGATAERGFWDLFEEVWLGYGEAMLLERRLHKGEGVRDAAAFQRVLARSRPLILPAAAALFAADRAQDLGAVERICAPLLAGHQLFADLLHAEKDRALGSMTHVLWRLGGGGPIEAAALRAELFVRGGFDAIVSDARGQIALARGAAGELGMPGAVRFLEGRDRHMTRVQQAVFEAFFSGRSG
jgi:hypothetical protein